MPDEDPEVVFCPRCGGRLLKIFAIDETGVPHGRSGHELVFRCSVVSRCSGCDHAIVESADHDCFSMDMDEPGDGWGWGLLEPADADRLLDGPAHSVWLALQSESPASVRHGDVVAAGPISRTEGAHEFHPTAAGGGWARKRTFVHVGQHHRHDILI